MHDLGNQVTVSTFCGDVLDGADGLVCVPSTAAH